MTNSLLRLEKKNNCKNDAGQYALIPRKAPIVIDSYPNEEKKWHSSDFRRATKHGLYAESTAPTRRRWIQKTLGGLFIFWLLSQAITPWTGLHKWERALPEFESKLADEKLQDANAWIFGSSTVLHHVIPICDLLRQRLRENTWPIKIRYPYKLHIRILP